MTKVLTTRKHYIGATHGASADYYGGPKEDLGRTGKVNILSGCVYRDVYCLIFKEFGKNN